MSDFTLVQLGALTLSTYGVLDGDGARWRVTGPPAGWTSSPLDTPRDPLPTAHGTRSGASLGPGQLYTVSGTVTASSLAGRWRAQRVLEDVLADLSGTLALAVTTLDTETAYVRRDGALRLEARSPTVLRFEVDLYADDPRRYGPAETHSTGLPAVVSGFALPAALPKALPAGSSSGAVTFDNTGNAPSPPVVVFTGPASKPRVAQSGRDRLLEFDLVLAAGDVLTVDVRAGTAMLNGSAHREHTVTARSVAVYDWVLDPGPTEVVFGADAYEPAAGLALTAAPARM